MDFCRLFNGKITVCSQCQKEMEALFIRFKVDRYDAVSIYYYSPFIKKLIYQFKGCYDYELCDVFLHEFYSYLKLIYFNRVIIPIPSYKNDDELRGFNHVMEIFKRMGLTILDILEKTEKHKQAISTVDERHKVYKYLAIKEPIDLSKKNVLIVDDVYTTGSTMKSAINLVEKLNPKSIKVLVVAKTKPKHSAK